MTDTEKTILKDELLQKLDGLRAVGADMGVEVCADENEYASLIADRNVKLIMQERNAVEIRQIEQALDRINTPDYGVCSECGEEISFTRMKARPTAELCVECQAEAEEEKAA
jgi:DnaK suppressor protein